LHIVRAHEHTKAMVRFGWVVCMALCVVVLLLAPIRVGVFGAFSLFDAQLGVRVRLFGVPVRRIWAEPLRRVVLRNGRPYHSSRARKGKAIEPRRYVSLLRAALPCVRYSIDASILLGTWDEAHLWLPLALFRLPMPPHVHISAYGASEQVCKGVFKVKLSFCLWDVLRVAVRYGSLRRT